MVLLRCLPIWETRVFTCRESEPLAPIQSFQERLNEQ
jgi:hypothetical protein